MTIRKTLLLAFLLVSLIPAMLLTSLAFFTAGDAMRKEINASLRVQSATIAENIDKLLFERLQNALSWRRQEVMQDILINDVDKRLSNFLSELKQGYGDVYSEIMCINPQGRIVASSHTVDIGQSWHVASGERYIAGDVVLEPLQVMDDVEGASLVFRTSIPSLFREGVAGDLLLRFNWGEMYKLLDQAELSGRMVLLLDQQQRVIAASRGLREKGLLLSRLPHGWLPQDIRAGTVHLDGAPLKLTDVAVGYDRTAAFKHFPGMNWTVLVLQPSHQAFIPIQRMALVFLTLLLVASAFAFALSVVVARRISRPITALTDFTRQFMQQQTLPTPPQETGGEVGELTSAFVQTVHALDRSRADLVRASKLAVLGELAAVMAHEIRTPLGILRSSAQMLEREPNLSSEARELTGFISSETERLNGLVTMLLDSARPRAPNFQQHDMVALIRHVSGLLAGQAEKKNVRLELQMEMQNALLSCDAEQMTQVLLNLILNALQILPAGGVVEVACERHGNIIRIDVADNGPGIADADVARVFDPFFTRREGGVGLGLAVVQQIITAHGGTINAGKSKLGGALFSIRLPYEETT